MRPLHPAPLLKPTGSRTVDRGPWFILVDPVPRYPAIDNEIDERAADLDRSAPIRCQLAENIGAQRPPQIHRTDARAPNNCSSCSSWRTNRAVKSTGQLQGNYKTRTRLDIIPCYQWPKDRITRPRAPRISGQIAQFRGKSTGIRRPRPPCRPAGAWAMFLTNSCYKNDIGYNYAIISYFRGPDP